MSVEEIKAANDLTSNLLSIGQKLIIPRANEVENPSNFQIYTVKSGDTLYGIARKYGLTADQLISYNNLSSTNLSIGQTLLIPTEEESNDNYTTYTVKAGDSLYSIARQNNTTVDALKQANNLTTNLLSIGQTLIIPTTTSVPSTPTNPNDGNSNTSTYTVQSGDNLYSIARRYNTTVTELKQLNNLTSNLLSINQKLIVPSTNTENIYVVKSGDNLYAIARKYNTTVDAIKSKNNLTSNNLSIGQILIV